MFKEKYKRDMEQVTPSPESISKTKEKMMEACVKKPRRLYSKRIIAVAVCLLLLSGAATSSVLHKSSNANYENDLLGSPYISNSDSNKNALSGDAKLEVAGSYKDIYSKIRPVIKKGYWPIELADYDEPTVPSRSENNNSTGKDFSDTNNQVEGVQEADIIKTDGKYIYACGNTVNNFNYYFYYNFPQEANKSKVYILSADNGKLTLASTINFRSEYENTRYILREMLLYKNTLVLIKEGFQYNISDSSDTSRSVEYGILINRTTSVEIYDITDRTNPVLINELYQSGSYASSRMVGEDLYIISNYFFYNPDKNKPETYIPYCSTYNRKYLVPEDCIFIPETVMSPYYNVITGIDLTEPENHKSSVATLGFSGTIYASDKNIYIASYTNANQKLNQNSSESSKNKSSVTITDVTDIYRFSIKDGTVTLSASGQIKGKLINQFAMDEYKDALRVAVTVTEYTIKYIESNYDTYPELLQQKTYNNLYILDMNINQTGSITNMAQDERIYSVRFDGEIGYVVTFRQVDPLFAIDLSDVKAPKVLSALKIPGFSTYMHPYGDGLLFGIGLDSGNTDSIKLSMFDITDKTNVTEKTVYKLGAESHYSEALYNHKAILVDPEKNIIGFAVNEYNADYNTKFSYKIFRYENNEFKEVASLPLRIYNSFQYLRGLYIGDYLYIYSQNEFVNSYDMNTLSQVDSFLFN